MQRIENLLKEATHLENLESEATEERGSQLKYKDYQGDDITREVFRKVLSD